MKVYMVTGEGRNYAIAQTDKVKCIHCKIEFEQGYLCVADRTPLCKDCVWKKEDNRFVHRCQGGASEHPALYCKQKNES